MHRTVSKLVLPSLLVVTAASAFAQGVPTTQPKFMHIFREQVKVGRSGEHAKWEAGWPAAFEKAKSPYHYLALASVTGPTEVWYVSTLDSQAAYGEMLASESSNAALSTELARLQKGDGEFLNDGNAIQAVALPELSHGEFPDIAPDALLGDHDLSREAGAPRVVRRGDPGLHLRREAHRAVRPLEDVRGDRRRPGGHVPRLLFRRLVRRVRQGAGRRRGDLEGPDQRGELAAAGSSGRTGSSGRRRTATSSMPARAT